MSEPTLPPILAGVHRIVLLGDSITEGGDFRGGYVWLLRQALGEAIPGVEIINSGISGHRSNDMLERFDRDVLRHKPDLMTMSVGVNDVWHGFDDEHPDGDGPRGIPLDAYRKNVAEMVRQAKAAGIRVVILSGTIMYEDLNSPENVKALDYNAVLREIAKESDSLFVDFQPPFRELVTRYREETGLTADFLTTDGIHLNDEGNALMANTLLAALGL